MLLHHDSVRNLDERVSPARLNPGDSSSDLTLICKGYQIQVHRCMMAAISPMMNSILSPFGSGYQPGIYTVTEFSPMAVYVFVYWTYFGDIATPVRYWLEHYRATVTETDETTDFLEALGLDLSARNWLRVYLELSRLASYYGVSALHERALNELRRWLATASRDPTLRKLVERLVMQLEDFSIEEKAFDIIAAHADRFSPRLTNLQETRI